MLLLYVDVLRGAVPAAPDVQCFLAAPVASGAVRPGLGRATPLILNIRNPARSL